MKKLTFLLLGFLSLSISVKNHVFQVYDRCLSNYLPVFNPRHVVFPGKILMENVLLMRDAYQFTVVS
ncbi:hypothetical protein [Pedobacter sp. N23S346]|uniref:hypothetical protein n=1 Tax=Pedobacter sp. N23S346 TaxID=3402750 RepID=UPI003ABF0335